MEPATFEAQITWLSRSHQVADLATAADARDRRGRLPRRMAALTFDDGFDDFSHTVWPILKRLALPAAVFVVAETVRRGWEVDWVDDPPAEPLITLERDQVRELADSGVEVGSHSLTHRTLTDLTYEECLEDLRTSKGILEDLIEREVPHLAYPRGRHDAGVRRAARTAGYRRSFSLPETPEPTGDQSVPRVGVFRKDGGWRFRAKTLRSYPVVRTSPVYERVRTGLGRWNRS